LEALPLDPVVGHIVSPDSIVVSLEQILVDRTDRSRDELNSLDLSPILFTPSTRQDKTRQSGLIMSLTMV